MYPRTLNTGLMPNGATVDIGGTSFGAIYSATEVDAMIAAGMGRSMTVGSSSTGIVGGGNGTVYDEDQPEFAIGIPEGYAMKLLRAAVQVQTGLFAADNDENEILIGVDTRGALQGPLSAETCTIETPVNMRSDLGYGSALQCASAFTADMQIKPRYSAASDPIASAIEWSELARAVETADLFSTGTGIMLKRLDVLYQPINPRLLVGPCTVVGYWGGTVATLGGFAQLDWVEGPTSAFFRRA